MPLWTWEQVYNFVGKEAPPRSTKKMAELLEAAKAEKAAGVAENNP